MPYDEFDADDPLELVSCEVPLGEEHLTEMAECFVAEFARLGYNADSLLALFRNPHYRGPHRVYEARGEDYVRDLIEQMVGERPAAPSSAQRALDSPAPAIGEGLVSIGPMRPAPKE